MKSLLSFKKELETLRVAGFTDKQVEAIWTFAVHFMFGVLNETGCANIASITQEGVDDE